MPVGQEIPMSLINGLRWCQVCKIVACTWLLSSCGGSGDGADRAYAYVANEGRLSTYSINPSTGGLTASVDSPLVLPTSGPFGGISQIATDPSGQFLGEQLRRPGSAGKMSQNVPGSPYATDTGPYRIVADPSGSVLYMANDGVPTATEATPGSISAFTIDSSTGALAPVSGNPQPIAAGGAISIDPMGRFLLVPEISGVSVYAIDTTTGALSAVAGSPFPAGTDPSVVSIDPTDRFVYVVNDGSANVSEFTLESTGALTPLAGSPAPVGNNPGSMAVVWH
jgi:6-phosphogluconolactonase